MEWNTIDLGQAKELRNIEEKIEKEENGETAMRCIDGG